MNSTTVLTPEHHDKNQSKAVGRWTKEEHQKFVEALKLYGKNWKQVEEHVGTRNGAQIRSHAQKFFNRLEREMNLKESIAKQTIGGKIKEKSQRKASECSVSTNCSYQEVTTETQTLIPASSFDRSEKDLQGKFDIETQSMPPGSPKQSHIDDDLKEIKRPPRKMSADVILTARQSLLDLVLSKLQNHTLPKLSDLVDMPTSSSLKPLQNNILTNTTTMSAFRPNPRKLSEDNVLIREKLNLLRKPELLDYESLSKKVKPSEENH